MECSNKSMDFGKGPQQVSQGEDPAVEDLWAHRHMKNLSGVGLAWQVMDPTEW